MLGAWEASRPIRSGSWDPRPQQSVLIVSVDVKQRLRTELRSCVKVEVAVLGSRSLIILMVSV